MTRRSKTPPITAGLDLGDTTSSVCLLDADGNVTAEQRLRTTPTAFRKHFADRERLRVAIETGAHSPWVSRLLASFGHEVLVANARKVRLIYGGARKSDQLDAHKLARLARFDPQLLAPIEHRGEQAQADLAVIRTRDVLVATRTKLINHARGSTKAFGYRLPSCPAASFATTIPGVLPEMLKPALEPVLAMIAALSEQILALDAQLATLAQARYPDAARLRQVHGVGTLTALTFVLTLETPERFRSSRTVGAFLGLAPGRDQSGASDPRRGITKEGNTLVRTLLVQCANYLLGPLGKDSDLKRWGEHIMARGGRKKAVVAVARKLAVLLHRLWVSGETYEPLRNHRRRGMSGATGAS